MVTTPPTARASGRIHVDVEAANVEKRLAPVFEYLNRYLPSSDDDGNGEIGDALHAAVKDAIDAARGGLRDARSLVFSALFFAWVASTPIVAPRDPFLATSKWKLPTGLFVLLVKKSGLEQNLRAKLRDDVPPHVSKYLDAELQGYDIEFIHESEGSKKLDENTVEESKPMSPRPLKVAAESDEGEAASPCGRCFAVVNEWLLLNEFATGDRISSAVESIKRIVREYGGEGRLTASMLLSSNAFHSARRAISRSDVSREKHLKVEQELIAILNRITTRRDGGRSEKTEHRSDDGLALAIDLLSPLLREPEMTLSRLVHTAAVHSSQAPFLVSAFTALPGLAMLKLEPTHAPFILEVLVRVLRNPPLELRGFNQLAGIKNLTVALFGEHAKEEESLGFFGHRFLAPRRSILDPRETLLLVLFPILVAGGSTSPSSNIDEGEVGASGSEGEMCALQILRALLVGDDASGATDVDPPLSSSGLKLLESTFPGAVLLSLGSYVDSRGADSIGSSPTDLTGCSGSSSCRGAPERTRDLAASLLRSCVRALEISIRRRLKNSDDPEFTSLLHSLAVADATAAVRLTWHTRIVMERVMGPARNLHPLPKRTPPTAPKFQDMGFGSPTGVTSFALALADLMRLCAMRAVSTVDLVDLLRGERTTGVTEGILGSEVLAGRIETIENAESPSLLRAALLMASSLALPTCTMKEFGVVQRELLPKILLLISRSENSGNSENTTAEVLWVNSSVVDFLSRVLLTHISGSKSRASTNSDRELEVFSRQLATAAVAGNEKLAFNVETEANVATVAGVFQNLKSLHAALLQVTALETEALEKKSREKAKDILLNAVLKLVGVLSAIGLQLEVEKLFDYFPEEQCKKQVLTACQSKTGRRNSK